MIQRLALLFVFSTLVSACGSKPAGLEPVTLTEAQGKLFENSCKNCHAQAGNRRGAAHVDGGSETQIGAA